MDSIIELAVIYFIGAVVIALNIIDIREEVISLKKVSRESILHAVTSLEIKLTLSLILFELSSLYIIALLVEKMPLNVNFAVATALFAASILLMTYFAFIFVSKTEKFSKLFKNIKKQK
ncbi:MAG: hypothetical protein M1594_01805 [Candidatus Marsarchaeota archaeon]|nr:hypothetical protein [Candidatus Marsarchaeota archaeon]